MIDIRMYATRLCSAAQEWRRFFAAEGVQYDERKLAELPGEIPAAEAMRCGLVDSQARRACSDNPNDWAFHLCPTVFVIHPDGRWNLIAEGTGPEWPVKEEVQP